ncbi:hypothetical protein CAPTEDRAFT_192040, partial [Capitella teleta]
IQNKEKMFWSEVLVDSKKYASSLWDKSKKCCEQSAAIVCLRALGLDPHSKVNNAKVSHKISLSALDSVMASPVEDMANNYDIAGSMANKHDIAGGMADKHDSETSNPSAGSH